MDSITKAINDWLLTYKPITDVAVVHTEYLPDEVNTLALQRSGVEDLPQKYTADRGWYRQYQYILLLKSNSEDDTQRLSNLDWIDNLHNWIDTQNQNKNFPILSNMKVDKANCANGILYQEDETNQDTIYYLQLYFNIKGGI